MSNEELNKFIYFLNDQTKPLSAQLLGELYKQKHNQRISITIMLKELERLKLLDISGENYSLSIHKRTELKILPNDFESKPYDYFLFEFDKKELDEFNSKWYNSENARKQYEDYSTTQWMAKAGFGISIILLILELIKLIIQKN